MAANISVGGISAVVVALLTLIVSFAIDSIQESDPLRHRVIVVGFGVAALIPGSLAIFVGILSISIPGLTSDVLYYTGWSAITGLSLTGYVILVEGMRGLEDENALLYLLYILAIVVLFGATLELLSA